MLNCSMSFHILRFNNVSLIIYQTLTSETLSAVPLPATSLALNCKDALTHHLPPGIKMHTNQDNSVAP